MSNEKSVYELTRAVLEVEAPDEIFLLDNWSINRQHGTSEGPHGFGESIEATILLLPVLWRFFDSFVNELGKEMGKGSAEYIRNMLKKKVGQQNNCSTTSMQVAELAEIVNEELKSQRIDAVRRKNLSTTIAEKMIKHAKR